MREQKIAEKVKSWSRIAASVGVLLSQPKVRAKMEALLKDRIDSLSDNIGEKYDDVAHRFGDARAALRGRNPWGSRAVGFVVGVGVGAGLGIMLAPKSGAATRNAIRGSAVNFKDTVVESASSVVGRAAKSIA